MVEQAHTGAEQHRGEVDRDLVEQPEVNAPLNTQDADFFGTHLGHLRGYPEIQEPAKAARDSEMARALWKLSARLTSVPETIRTEAKRRSEKKTA
jgi:hypothetical protein